MNLSILALALLSISSTKAQETATNGNNNETICEDPITAILATMDCMATQDSECTAAGYAPDGLYSIYNGEEKNNGDPEDRSLAGWQGINALSHISLVTWDTVNIGPNMASFSYNETTVMTDGTTFGLEASGEYPFNATHFISESAIVTVNGDCQIYMWNASTDDAEMVQDQMALDTNYQDLVAVPEIYCIFFADDPNCVAGGGPTSDDANTSMPTTVAPTTAAPTDPSSAFGVSPTCWAVYLAWVLPIVFAVAGYVCAL